MVAILVLGQAAGFGPAGGVPGVPLACQLAWARAGNVWERAKRPELLRYCDLIGSARAKLSSGRAGATSALDAAREARRMLPERVEALVIQGRALVVLGDGPGAVLAFRAAVARDPTAIDEPSARLAWARALARTGEPRLASDVYRSLEPWVGELRGEDRGSAELEIGVAAMSMGREGLDDAVNVLRAATRENSGEARNLAIVALALALDRRGDLTAVREALSSGSMGDPRDRIQTPYAKAVFTVAPSDALAAAALALEVVGERAGAADTWQASLEADPNGPWADYSKAHAQADRSRAPGRP